MLRETNILRDKRRATKPKILSWHTKEDSGPLSYCGMDGLDWKPMKDISLDSLQHQSLGHPTWPLPTLQFRNEDDSNEIPASTWWPITFCNLSSKGEAITLPLFSRGTHKMHTYTCRHSYVWGMELLPEARRGCQIPIGC